MSAFAVLFLLLLVLELLFWGPGRKHWKDLKDQIYRRRNLQYVFPPEYVTRVLIALIVLFALASPEARRVPDYFIDGRVLYSVIFGLVLTLLGLYVSARSSGMKFRDLLKSIVGLFRKREALIHAAYVLVWVSTVEEFIFRGLFIELLTPGTGYWAVVLATVSNLIWHIPVWVVYAREGLLKVPGGHMRGAIKYAGTTLPVVFMLSNLYYFTGSLIGPIMVHFFGDIAGVAIREKHTQMNGRFVSRS